MRRRAAPPRGRPASPCSATCERAIVIVSDQGTTAERCSAKGCQQPARWALRWNNPKIHPPERRKTWLACDDHREHLADFLRLRTFLREVEPFEPKPT
jgi:hypothetical protein